MYRISVTNIEAFRRYMAEASPFDTEQAVINSIKGLFKGTAKTMTGSAYHKLIENPGHRSVRDYFHGDACFVAVDNIAFPEAAALEAVRFHREHPLMVWEVPVTKVYHTSYGPVLVSGRVDGLEGCIVHDSKTKYSNPHSIDGYMDSVQWRFYLDMLGLNQFHYNVFEVKGFKDFDINSKGLIVQEDMRIVRHEPITCYRYMDMGRDCLAALDMFMEFVHAKKLTGDLKQVDPVTHQTIFSNQ